MSEFYEKVYEKHDPTPKGAHGWIQWKGTEVCMDIHCTCGAHLHADESFFYFFRCPHCKTVYAVGQNVRLIPLTEELIRMRGLAEMQIKRLEPDEDMPAASPEPHPDSQADGEK